MQLAAPAHFEAVGQVRLAHAQRHVLAQLAVEPLLEIARGDVFAFQPGKRRVVDHPEHRHRRLVDGDRHQRLGRDRVGERLADLHVREAGHGHDLARRRLRHVLALEALERGEPRDSSLFLRAVAEDEHHVLALPHLAALNAPDASHIVPTMPKESHDFSFAANRSLNTAWIIRIVSAGNRRDIKSNTRENKSGKGTDAITAESRIRAGNTDSTRK